MTVSVWRVEGGLLSSHGRTSVTVRPPGLLLTVHSLTTSGHNIKYGFSGVSSGITGIRDKNIDTNIEYYFVKREKVIYFRLVILNKAKDLCPLDSPEFYTVKRTVQHIRCPSGMASSRPRKGDIQCKCFPLCPLSLYIKL